MNPVSILSDVKRWAAELFTVVPELFKQSGVKIRHKAKLYDLVPTANEALGRLPFPDLAVEFCRDGRTGPMSQPRPEIG